MNLLQSWVSFRDASTFESSIIIWFIHAAVVVLIAWLCAEVLSKQFAVMRYRIWIITCCSLLLLASFSFFDSFLSVSLRVLPATSVESVHVIEMVDVEAAAVNERASIDESVTSIHMFQRVLIQDAKRTLMSYCKEAIG